MNNTIQKIKNYYHLGQSFLFNLVYRFPAQNLKVIGITGTDGKTTSSHIIYHILKTNGIKVGLISTLGGNIDGEEIDTGLHVTTPEPWDLPRILRKIVNHDIEHVVLESTSSGLDQNRLYGVTFDSSTITNIGVDHLDYHGTWENYANAKFKLVGKTKNNGKVVLNNDHERSANWLKDKLKSDNSHKIEWYSGKDVSNLEMTVEGIEFDYKDVSFHVPIIGEYNLENLLGAIKICEEYLTLDQISIALKSFKTPKGRMQIMQDKPYSIIVDFAHTPSSLDNALASIKKIIPDGGKLITIFGCAGDRDKTRRDMGKISLKYSDITILTLEDPRFEKVKDINDEILERAAGKSDSGVLRYESHDEYKNADLVSDYSEVQFVAFDYDEVQNRKDAIELGLKIAKENDVVFITGKGHEESLAIGDPVVEFEYTDQGRVKELIS